MNNAFALVSCPEICVRHSGTPNFLGIQMLESQEYWGSSEQPREDLQLHMLCYDWQWYGVWSRTNVRVLCTGGDQTPTSADPE